MNSIVIRFGFCKPRVTQLNWKEQTKRNLERDPLYKSCNKWKRSSALFSVPRGKIRLRLFLLADSSSNNGCKLFDTFFGNQEMRVTYWSILECIEIVTNWHHKRPIHAQQCHSSVCKQTRHGIMFNALSLPYVCFFFFYILTPCEPQRGAMSLH